jgi:hypothetical protein
MRIAITLITLHTVINMTTVCVLQNYDYNIYSNNYDDSMRIEVTMITLYTVITMTKMSIAITMITF